MDLDADQQLVVDHEDGPLVVVGTALGHGVSTALRARADRLRAEGRRPLLLPHSRLVAFAVEVLGRHGRGRVVRLATGAERRRVVAELLGSGDDELVDEVAATILGFQASFLGDEELRVHADAADALDRAEELIALTHRYVDALSSQGMVDAAGAVVDASLRLRDGEVLAAERSRFDELLVDDFQLATFATHRLVAQLVGARGAVTVGGCPDGAISTAPLANATHLERFERRFGGKTVGLRTVHRTTELPPELRLADDVHDLRAAAGTFASRGATVLGRDDVESFVGREAEVVLVDDASEGAWPAPRPEARWFDAELFSGPDVPDETDRDRRWRALERRRFLVASSRATRATVVVARTPISPFVGDLLR